MLFHFKMFRCDDNLEVIGNSKGNTNDIEYTFLVQYYRHLVATVVQ